MTGQVLSSFKVKPNLSLTLPSQNCRQFTILQPRMRNLFTFPHSVNSGELAIKPKPSMQSMCPNLFPPSLSKFQSRGIVKWSKRRGKLKTVKAVAKRFYRTGSGKLKYWPAGNVHNMLAKSWNRRRNLRKPRYASKIQMKTLNKMISGW